MSDPGSTDQAKKRKRLNSATSDNICSSITASSPPKFVSVEELMNVAVGLDKMALMHEILIDPQFRLQKPHVNDILADKEPLSPVSPIRNFDDLESTVRRVAYKAYWDCIQADLNENPPRYDRLLKVVEEIKEALLSLLLAQHDKLKSDIEERIDLQLIRQQCEKKCFDFRPLALYILDVMAKLCAPVRDDAIENLRRCDDICDLLKGVFGILADMKLDMANFTISAMRPELQQRGVEYERQKFNDYLKINTDGLNNTIQWLRAAMEDLTGVNCTCAAHLPSSSETTASCSEHSLKPNVVVFHAFCAVLSSFDDEQLGKLPETLIVDQSRLRQMRSAFLRLVLNASIVNLVANFLGKNSPCDNASKLNLKDRTSILLKDLESRKTSDVLPIVAEQCCAFVETQVKSVSGGVPNVDLLKAQICAVLEPNNAILTIITKRVKSFMMQAFSNPAPNGRIEIPAGLNIVSDELTQLTGSFLRILSYNVQVFGEHYTRILTDLLRRDNRDCSVSEAC